MQRIIVFLYYALLCACGGGSLIVEADKEVDRVDVGKNQDNLPYPGFYEIEKEHKLSLLQEDFDYHDGYLDRHESTLRKDQTFYMDVVTREVIENFSDFAQSSSSANINYSSSVEIHRGINVEADYGVSDLFLLAGKVNYVDVILSWEVDEKPEDLKEHKFYICNPQNVHENLFEDFYILPDEAWNVPKSSASKSYALRINRPGKYGLCRQYKDYTPVIYDEINVLEYPGSEFDVSIVNIGAEQLKLNNIKNNQDYFYRAGVNLKFEKSQTYNTPENFTDESYKWHQYIRNREDYLFVRGPFENEESEHKCYQYIKDDVTLMSYWIKREVESNNLDKRIAILYNKNQVKFWTFYLDEEVNIVLPCYEEMASNIGAKPNPNKKYKVAVLNTSRENCNFIASDISYDNMYIINENKTWNAYSNGKIYPLNDFSKIFDPRCHVFLDMDEYSRPYENGKSYLKSVITGNAEAVTDEFTIGIDSRPIGLWSHNDPNNGIRTFMHELGHLLGLVDVIDDSEKKKNLMHYQKLEKQINSPDPNYLNNKPMNVKEYPAWEQIQWGGKEKQWDCLNNISPTINCALEIHRNLSF